MMELHLQLLLGVDGEMTKWKNEIETLREKIQDSLQVMNIVSGKCHPYLNCVQ